MLDPSSIIILFHRCEQSVELRFALLLSLSHIFLMQISMDSEGSQVVSAPTPAQLRNIAAINILYHFCAMINKVNYCLLRGARRRCLSTLQMIAEQQNLSSTAVDRITDALQVRNDIVEVR